VITTDDEELADRLYFTRSFGYAGYDTVVALGINAKMDELSAALALTGLEHLDELVAVNRRNHRAYERLLAGVDDVRLLRYDESERNNYQYVVLEVEGALERDTLIAALHAENVLARRYFHPGCHRSPPYSERGLTLDVTERVSGRVVALPTGTAIEEDDIEIICSIIALAAQYGDEIAAALPSSA